MGQCLCRSSWQAYESFIRLAAAAMNMVLIMTRYVANHIKSPLLGRILNFLKIIKNHREFIEAMPLILTFLKIILFASRKISTSHESIFINNKGKMRLGLLNVARLKHVHILYICIKKRRDYKRGHGLIQKAEFDD
jgi:hypothetical protein